MFNVTLAEEVLEAITKRHPEAYDQSDYRTEAETGCGTSMCIAGWAAQLAGGKWLSNNPNHILFDGLVPDDDDDPRLVHEYNENRYVSAYNRGRRVLGLTQDQAQRIFSGSLTNDEAISGLRRSIAAAKASAARKAK